MHAKRKPYILGITGGIASGKTAATDYLKTLGATAIDADQLSHELTAPGGEALPSIREAFGGGVFLEDGTLNRRALGEIIFHDAEKRRILETILHPAIQKRMLEEIDKAADAGAQVVVLNVPLLLETGMDVLCDSFWVMALEPEQQALRLMNRDRMTRQQAEARIACQMPLEEKIKNATAVIWTNRPSAETQRELAQLYKDLIRRIEYGR